MRVPLTISRNRPENHSHNLGKALGEGLGLLCAPFTLSIPFISLSLSPLYPYHLSIPFTSLSLSPLYIFHLSIPFTSLSLSPLSLSLISPSLSKSLILPFFLSLFSFILFGISNGRFRPCLYIFYMSGHCVYLVGSWLSTVDRYWVIFLMLALILENIKDFLCVFPCNFCTGCTFLQFKISIYLFLVLMVSKKKIS